MGALPRMETKKGTRMSTQDEMIMRQYKAVQNQYNSYNQGNFNDNFNDVMRQRNPFQGADLNAYTATELQDMITVLNKVHEQKTMHTPMWSPTRAQCLKHESLNNAYNELLVIKKLVGL